MFRCTTSILRIGADGFSECIDTFGPASVWSAGAQSQQSSKPKPQKADLLLLISKESLKTKKKKQQYLCLAFFRKQKTRVLQS